MDGVQLGVVAIVIEVGDADGGIRVVLDVAQQALGQAQYASGDLLRRLGQDTEDIAHPGFQMINFIENGGMQGGIVRLVIGAATGGIPVEVARQSDGVEVLLGPQDRPLFHQDTMLGIVDGPRNPLPNGELTPLNPNH